MESLKEVFSYIISPVIITGEESPDGNFNVSFQKAMKRLKQINFKDAKISKKESIQVGQINVALDPSQTKNERAENEKSLLFSYIQTILKHSVRDQIFKILASRLAEELHISDESLLTNVSSVLFIENNYFEKDFHPQEVSKTEIQEKIENIFAKHKYHRSGILELLILFIRKLTEHAQETLKSKLEDEHIREFIQKELGKNTISITVVVKLECPEEFSAYDKKTSLVVKPVIVQFDEKSGTDKVQRLKISESTLHLKYYPEEVSRDVGKGLNVGVTVNLQITQKKE